VVGDREIDAAGGGVAVARAAGGRVALADVAGRELAADKYDRAAAEPDVFVDGNAVGVVTELRPRSIISSSDNGEVG
jgi:hypothetical protein